MSNGFTSPFQELNQTMISIEFSCNELLNSFQTDASNVSISAGFDDDPKEFPGTDTVYVCRCVADISVSWLDRESDTEVCKSRCRLAGLYTLPRVAFPDDYSEKDARTHMHANSISMLYAKARSIIEGISSQSITGKKTLLAIDPFAYVTALEENEG